VAGAQQGLLQAAHDLSDGGLAQTLVESCLAGGVGARISVAGDAFVALFSESAGRAVVAVTDDRFENLCAAEGLPVTGLGVAGGTTIEVDGVLSVPLAELRTAHETALPAIFD
jgi:phosphoribosylformylglycinamidine synthase